MAQNYSYSPMQIYTHVFSGPPAGSSLTYGAPWVSNASLSVPTSLNGSSNSQQFVISSQPMSSVPTSPVQMFPSPAAFVAHSHFPGPNYNPATNAREVVWYPDSGATHHITSDRANLQTDESYACMNSLLMGNGDKVKITHIGNSSLVSEDRSLMLHNLLCVPDIKKNLLSVSHFARDNNVFFEFYSEKCFVKDVQTKVTLLEGRLTHEDWSVSSSEGSNFSNPNGVSTSISGGTFPLVVVSSGPRREVLSKNISGVKQKDSCSNEPKITSVLQSGGVNSVQNTSGVQTQDSGHISPSSSELGEHLQQHVFTDVLHMESVDQPVMEGSEPVNEVFETEPVNEGFGTGQLLPDVVVQSDVGLPSSLADMENSSSAKSVLKDMVLESDLEDGRSMVNVISISNSCCKRFLLSYPQMGLVEFYYDK
ncbi:hypothetical protein GQ457_18G013270 [Hibiscus cannabinus]